MKTFIEIYSCGKIHLGHELETFLKKTFIGLALVVRISALKN
jgi:hypothetical protein